MSDLPTGLRIWYLALCSASAVNIGLLVYFWIAPLAPSLRLWPWPARSSLGIKLDQLLQREVRRLT